MFKMLLAAAVVAGKLLTCDGAGRKRRRDERRGRRGQHATNRVRWRDEAHR